MQPFLLPIVRLVLSAIAFFATIVCATAGEVYQPVRLTPLSTLSFPADPRLNFGQEGTVEFWLSATADTEQLQCVMSHGEGDKLDFAVQMHAKRKAIYLKTRSLTYSVPFDFSDAEFHHVAFMTSGGITTVLIDGVKPGVPGDDPDVVLELPDVPAPIGHPGVTGQAIALGCNDPGPFEGWVYSLRFWDKALSAGELESVRPFYGLPTPGSFDNIERLNSDHLLAYATFSSERRSLYYREKAINAETLETRPPVASDVMLLRRSFLPDDIADRKLSRIYWQNGARGIRDLRFEFSREGSVPVLLPRPGNWDAQKQRTLEKLASTELRQAGTFEPEVQRVLTEAYRLQGLYNPNTDVGKRALNVTTWNIFQLRDGEEIWSIAGVHDTADIQGLRFFTNQRTFNSPLMGSPGGSSEIFHLERPAFSSFEGLAIGRDAKSMISSISLLYSKGDVPDQYAPLVALTKGRWVERDGCLPRLNDEMAFLKNHRHPVSQNTLMHGLYTTPTIVRYMFNPASRSLTQWTDRQLAFGDREEDSGHCGAAQVGSPVLESEQIVRFDNDKANTFKGIKKGRNHALLLLTRNGSVIETENGGEDLPGPFVRATRKDSRNKDKIAWGGTFSLPHRPPNVRANFVGYDITQLDPHNYLKSHGMKKAVFEYPDDTSSDYQTIDNNLIVPNGMIFKNVSSGAENARTIMTAGSAEYKHAWAYSLGMNLGFGLDGFGAAFSANYSHSKRVENRTDDELITSITRSNAVRYSLVADRSKINLSDEFRRDVLAMRDRLLVDRQTPMAGFIAKYGTHYPYAVTYGGMAFLETTYSKEVVDHMVENSHSFEEKASVSFSGQSKSDGCGCGGGGSGGGLSGSLGVNTSFSKTDSLATEIRNSDESRLFGTYGGTVTRGEGWSLSAGEEVPLLFDLRPLSDLLSPLFFDDPNIWGTLRPRMEGRIRNYLVATTSKAAAPPPWYVSGKPGYVTKQPLVFGDAHRLKPDAKHKDDK